MLLELVAKFATDDERAIVVLNGERRESMVPASSGGAEGSRDFRGGRGPKVAPDGWGVRVARRWDGDRGGPMDESLTKPCVIEPARMKSWLGRANESREPKPGGSTDI